MGKSENDKPRFFFAKQAGTDNYKKWDWKMCYSFDFARFWNHTLLDNENPKPVAIVLKNKDLEDDAKLERQKKHADKIIAWSKNNVKCKDYINLMCLGHIQQKFRL